MFVITDTGGGFRVTSPDKAILKYFPTMTEAEEFIHKNFGTNAEYVFRDEKDKAVPWTDD